MLTTRECFYSSRLSQSLSSLGGDGATGGTREAGILVVKGREMWDKGHESVGNQASLVLLLRNNVFV